MIPFDNDIYYYDAAAADRVANWIQKYCRHVKGDKAGELIRLDAWQVEDIIKPVFGIKRRANGKRRFKTVYVEIPKGNAKSTLGSAIALYLLGADGQKGAEVYSVAGDREQARIIFDTAKGMIAQDKNLQKHFNVYQYSITKKASANFYKVLSAEAHTKHGFNPSGIVFDEVHVQPNRDLWDTLTAGQMKRDESICFAFTTAGYDKQSICWELHEKARKINEGVLQDESFYGLLYTVDFNADISAPETWAAANPGLGTIITVDNMAIEYAKVKANPSYENTFRRLHLNQWTDTYESWISDVVWMDQTPGRRDDELDGALCYGGLDLASTRDFNALVLAFPRADEYMDVKCWFWLPADMVDSRVQRLTNDFKTWVKDGYIKQTPGQSVDYNVIINDIRALAKRYNIKSIAFDRKFAAPIVSGLESDVKMTPFDQGILGISYPTKKLDILVGQRKINHFDNPVLRWMMGNVSLYRDANDNIKVVKHKSTDAVDGVVALIMAIGEYETFKVEKQSVYATRGVLEI